MSWARGNFGLVDDAVPSARTVGGEGWVEYPPQIGPLQANIGQFVTCGTYTGLRYLKPGDVCGVRFEGLGAAEVTFVP